MSVCSTSRVLANRTSCAASKINAANKSPPDMSANQGMRRLCRRVPNPPNVIASKFLLVSLDCHLRSPHAQSHFHDLTVKREQQGRIGRVNPTIIKQFGAEHDRSRLGSA